MTTTAEYIVKGLGLIVVLFLFILLIVIYRDESLSSNVGGMALGLTLFLVFYLSGKTYLYLTDKGIVQPANIPRPSFRPYYDSFKEKFSTPVPVTPVSNVPANVPVSNAVPPADVYANNLSAAVSYYG